MAGGGIQENIKQLLSQAGIIHNSSKTRCPRSPKRRLNVEKEEDQQKDHIGAEESVHAVPVKKKKKRYLTASAGLRSVSPACKAPSSGRDPPLVAQDIDNCTHLSKLVRQFSGASSVSSSDMNDRQCCPGEVAGASESGGQKYCEAESMSGNTRGAFQNNQSKKSKSKRKRRDCWDLATIAKQKTQLLQQLKNGDVRDKLSKSRLKRMKARLSLLAKAERGEVQVGGQLLPSCKRRKLLVKVRRSKEKGRKTEIGEDTAENTILSEKTKRKASKSGQDTTKGSGGAPTKKRKRIKKVCLNCRKKGHLLENCPATSDASLCAAMSNDSSTNSGAPLQSRRPAMSGLCFNCGSKEHTLKSCKKPKKADGSLPFALCFVCGRGGHISTHCPGSKTGKYPDGGCCRTCGDIFHLQADCPQRKNSRTGNAASVLKPSNAQDVTTGPYRGPKWKPSAPLPPTVSRCAPEEVDPDEYWDG